MSEQSVRDQAGDGGRRGGIVSLVGAGPGDPGLLTLRGRALLERADVVVYDYLANPELLAFARPGAEHVYVGKKAADHSMTQDQINGLLIQLGRSGKRVVRLKGGDPFVFGRGGEECEALAGASVAFEVVPGITAAIGAPAYAGIPVTHRDLNSSFTFVTGHEKEEPYKDPRTHGREAAGSSDLDWSVIAKLPAIAFYMGVKSLPRICAKLIEHGMDAATPAASIRWGTRPDQRTVVGTIADLPRRVADAKLAAPAITIVGRVVALRDTMNWFERRPLFGQTVVVTRTRQDASDLSAKLAELGARVIEAPTIEIAPPADPKPLHMVFRRMLRSRVFDTVLQRKLDKDHEAMRVVKWENEVAFDWVVFTSPNGVRHTREFLLGNGLDVRVFGATSRFAAVGAATAEAVRAELCVRPDLVPERAVADSLADALEHRNDVAGKRFLLLRADIGRPVLVERLKAAGAAEVTDIAVYETRRAASLPPHLLEALAAGDVDWVTFTSSSTARNFAELLGHDYRERLTTVRRASIGPITSTTLRELGLDPTVEAATADVAALVAAIRDAVERDRPPR